MGNALTLATQATEQASVSSSSYKSILWFGAAAMAMVALIQAIRIMKGGQFSANFTRLYGLVLVATLGAALVVANVDTDARTGAFTLFGTIAGYLAGARTSNTADAAGNEGGVL